MAKKLSKIIFLYEDKSVHYLEGRDAKKWQTVMNGLVSLGFTHAGQGQKELSKLKWKKASNKHSLFP